MIYYITQTFSTHINECKIDFIITMSSFRACFKLESIGYYPKSKSIYLTVSQESSSANQKISILLDRTEANLGVLGDIICEQKHKIKLVLDNQSKTLVQDKTGKDIVRFRAISIESECELSTLRY